jgi:hypothetical protein
MGKTFLKNSRRFDDENPSGRSGKSTKHANNRKTGGMRTLNSYVEEDYDDYDLNDDSFDDQFEVGDEISIQRNNTTQYKGK